MTKQIWFATKELNLYDATGNYIFSQKQLLTELGFHVEIACDVNNTKEKNIRQIKEIPDDSILMVQMTGDITPGEYFFDYDLSLAMNLNKARKNLDEYAKYFQMTISVSEYNRIELDGMGFANNRVVPIWVDFSKYENTKSQAIAGFDESKTNILYLGSLAPHKKIEDLVKTFYIYQKYLNKNSHLYLVGGFGPSKYMQIVYDLIEKLGIQKKIKITGKISVGKLKYIFEHSQIYLHLSNHEGFCVPLIEAMHFNIPIIANNSSGIPYTLAGAGILVDKENFEEIAEVIDEIIENPDLKDQILAGQRKKLEEFSKEKVKAQLKEMFSNIEVQPELLKA